MRAIRFIHKLTTILVLSVGVIHTAATLYFFDGLTERAVWFAGAGLGGIFVAFLNMGLWLDSGPSSGRRLVDLANLLFLLWLAAGVVATPRTPSFLVAAAGAVMALTGLVRSRSGVADDPAQER